ncbi:hypothetical protein, partial [Dysgonomonas sp.]
MPISSLSDYYSIETFCLFNPISVVFHFALMQNETKNQGCIPRRPKTVASVEQNNRESFFICLLAE